MLDYSREVRNPVSTNRNQLERSVANSLTYELNPDDAHSDYRRGTGKIKAGILGLCALALIPFSTARAGEGGEVLKNLFTGWVYEWGAGAINREHQRQMMNELTPARKIEPSLSPEEQAILEQYKRTPRVVHVGDVDNDGDEDWIYYNGKGGKYWASALFSNDKGVVSSMKDKEYFKQLFGYWDNKDVLRKVPENALVVYYEDPRMSQ